MPAQPFRQLLRPLLPQAIPAVALAAPLPLAALASQGMADADAALFVHVCSQVQVDVIALSGPATAAATPPPPDDAIALLYGVAGELIVEQQGVRRRAPTGGCLVVAAGPGHWRSSAFSVVCLLVSTAQLDLCRGWIRPGAERAAGSRPAARLPPAPGGRCCLRAYADADGACSLLLRALVHNLQTLADCLAGQRHLIVPLGLEESLGRLLLLLLDQGLGSDPGLGPTDPGFRLAGASPAVGGDASILAQFQQLLTYIDDHLDQPLNLTLLQTQLHASKRALQYAFQRQLGCTATQWIRTRRLDRAHRLLRHPASTDSVASIAQACGYRSMSLFSIEFQHRFHVKPSALLRQARSVTDRPPAL
jgi:AraC-like DNA-binding protein